MFVHACMSLYVYIVSVLLAVLMYLVSRFALFGARMQMVSTTDLCTVPSRWKCTGRWLLMLLLKVVKLSTVARYAWFYCHSAFLRRSSGECN